MPEDLTYQDPQKTGKPSPEKSSEVELSLDEFTEKVREHYKLPKNLVRALLVQESGDNPDVGDSPRKAAGRFQILRSTAESEFKGYDVDDPFDNTYMGLTYLKKNLDEARKLTKDPEEQWQLVLAGYHAGRGRIKEFYEKGIPESLSDGKARTTDYVDTIMSRWKDLQDRESPPETSLETPDEQGHILVSTASSLDQDVIPGKAPGIKAPGIDESGSEKGYSITNIRNAPGVLDNLENFHSAVLSSLSDVDAAGFQAFRDVWKEKTGEDWLAGTYLDAKQYKGIDEIPVGIPARVRSLMDTYKVSGEEGMRKSMDEWFRKERESAFEKTTSPILARLAQEKQEQEFRESPLMSGIEAGARSGAAAYANLSAGSGEIAPALLERAATDLDLEGVKNFANRLGEPSRVTREWARTQEEFSRAYHESEQARRSWSWLPTSGEVAAGLTEGLMTLPFAAIDIPTFGASAGLRAMISGKSIEEAGAEQLITGAGSVGFIAGARIDSSILRYATQTGVGTLPAVLQEGTNAAQGRGFNWGNVVLSAAQNGILSAMELIPHGADRGVELRLSRPEGRSVYDNWLSKDQRAYYNNVENALTQIALEGLEGRENPEGKESERVIPVQKQRPPEQMNLPLQQGLPFGEVTGDRLSLPEQESPSWAEPPLYGKESLRHVTEVAPSQSGKYFYVTTSDGRKTRISAEAYTRLRPAMDSFKWYEGLKNPVAFEQGELPFGPLQPLLFSQEEMRNAGIKILPKDSPAEPFITKKADGAAASLSALSHPAPLDPASDSPGAKPVRGILNVEHYPGSESDKYPEGFLKVTTMDASGKVTEMVIPGNEDSQLLTLLRGKLRGAGGSETIEDAAEGNGLTGELNALLKAETNGGIIPPDPLQSGEILNELRSPLSASLQKAAENARLRIRERNKGRFTAGIDPSDLADYAIIGASKLASGIIDFSKWSAEMVREFGKEIQPHLQNIWKNIGGEEKSVRTSRISTSESRSSLGATAMRGSETLRLSGEGRNYQEHYVKWDNPPDGVSFSYPAHYGTEKNIVYDYRTEERTTTTGENALFLMEAQSDWAQSREDKSSHPFRNTWLRQALRSAVKDANEKGLDGVLLPRTPEQVAEIQRWGKLVKRDGKHFTPDGYDVTPVIRRYTQELPGEARKLGRVEQRNVDINGEPETLNFLIPEEAERRNLERTLRAAKKFQDEPDWITEQRIINQRSLAGMDANMGRGVVAGMLTAGYDLYRTVKEFTPWAEEMIRRMGDDVKPFVHSLWDIMLFSEGTKVADERGPIEVFTATQWGRGAIEEFKREFSSEDNLYGPGAVYTTQSREIANGYAPKTHPFQGNAEADSRPHIYRLYLNIRNPFNIDRTWTRKELQDLETRLNNSASEDLKGRIRLDDGREMTGKELYTLLHRDYYGSKGTVNLALEAAGYDGITHIGGGGLGIQRRFNTPEEAEALAKEIGGKAIRATGAHAPDNQAILAHMPDDNYIWRNGYGEKISEAFPDEKSAIAAAPEGMKEYLRGDASLIEELPNQGVWEVEGHRVWIPFRSEQVLHAEDAFIPRHAITGRTYTNMYGMFAIDFASVRALGGDISRALGRGYRFVANGVNHMKRPVSENVGEKVMSTGRKVRRLFPDVFLSALELKSLNSNTKTRLFNAYQGITEALKPVGMSFSDFYEKVGMNDRLRMVRKDLLETADYIRNSPDLDTLLVDMVGGSRNKLSILEKVKELEGLKGLGDNLAQQARKLYREGIKQEAAARENNQTTNMTPLREFVADIFEQAEKKVTRIISDEEHDRLLSLPEVQKAISIWRTGPEAYMQEKFKATDATPSDRIGVAGYFPLLTKAQAEEARSRREDFTSGETSRRGITIFDRKGAPMQKPRSPRAYWTTGLGDYTFDSASLLATMKGVVAAGNKAAYIQSLLDNGAARRIGRITRKEGGESLKDPETGRVIRDEVEAPEGWIVVPEELMRKIYTHEGNGPYVPPAKMIAVHPDVWKWSERFLAGEKFTDENVERLTDNLIELSLIGLLEPVVHANNVLYSAHQLIPYFPLEWTKAETKMGQKVQDLISLASKWGQIGGELASWPIQKGAALAGGAISASGFPVLGSTVRAAGAWSSPKWWILAAKTIAMDPTTHPALLEYLGESASLQERIGNVTLSPARANQMGATLVGPGQSRFVRNVTDLAKGVLNIKHPKRSTSVMQDYLSGMKTEFFASAMNVISTERHRAILNRTLENHGITPIPEPQFKTIFQQGWEMVLEARKNGELTMGERARLAGTGLARFMSFFGLAPFIYGWDGIDVKTRLVAADAFLTLVPNASKTEVYDFMSHLGVYNRYFESEIGRTLKDARIAPFYSAFSAMSRNALESVFSPFGGGKYPARSEAYQGNGEGRIAIEKDMTTRGEKVKAGGAVGGEASMRLSYFLANSAAAGLGLWALAYKNAYNVMPWEDPGAKLMYMPVKKDDRDPILHPDPDKTYYEAFRVNDLIYRGFSSVGADRAFQALVRINDLSTGDFPVSARADLAGKQMFSGALSYFLRGSLATNPAGHTGFAALGAEPSLMVRLDPKSGNLDYSLSPAVVKGSQLNPFITMANASLALNSFAENALSPDWGAREANSPEMSSTQHYFSWAMTLMKPRWLRSEMTDVTIPMAIRGAVMSQVPRERRMTDERRIEIEREEKREEKKEGEFRIRR